MSVWLCEVLSVGVDFLNDGAAGAQPLASVWQLLWQTGGNKVVSCSEGSTEGCALRVLYRINTKCIVLHLVLNWFTQIKCKHTALNIFRNAALKSKCLSKSKVTILHLDSFCKSLKMHRLSHTVATSLMAIQVVSWMYLVQCFHLLLHLRSSTVKLLKQCTVFLLVSG